MMKLPDRVFDFLKWICICFLPAISWFIGEVGSDIGIANVPKVVKFISATATLLGLLIGLSNYNFKKENIIYTEPRNEGGDDAE